MSDDAMYALNGGESCRCSLGASCPEYASQDFDPDETLPALSTLTQDEINAALESLDTF